MPEYDPDLLAQAGADRDEDVSRLAALRPDQLRYLARAHELPDPLTDGLECDEERRSRFSSYSDPSSGDGGTSPGTEPEER